MISLQGLIPMDQFKHDVTIPSVPAGTHCMCGSCGAELPAGYWHSCPGSTHSRIRALEQRVRELERRLNPEAA